jgi:hypothetical protein
MIDHLAGRQMSGLGTDRAELNGKLEALACHFDLDWLKAGGSNPLQILWGNRDALATNELLNFGDAVKNFEGVDSGWLEKQVSAIKADDAGNRAGAIFELLGLNFFLFAKNKVSPTRGSNPGYDGVVELPDQSTLLVSIKNHGMTSYETFFQRKAKELDDQFTEWLRVHGRSGVELRIVCPTHLETTEWDKLKKDVMDILDGQLDGTAKDLKIKSNCSVILKNLTEYHPLSITQISSVVFVRGKAHKNEQAKFVEDLRKGCANLVEHTKNHPESACPVLFVRLCANASISNCQEWASDYFGQFPDEQVGLILLYQAAVVTSRTSSSLTHYMLPIMGPQFNAWARPPGKPARRLPDLGVLIGQVSPIASRKVIQLDDRQIPLDDSYVYQRGDIYRFYRFDGSRLEAQMSNPAPKIKIHAEIGNDRGSVVLQGISPATGELLLLP